MQMEKRRRWVRIEKLRGGWVEKMGSVRNQGGGRREFGQQASSS